MRFRGIRRLLITLAVVVPSMASAQFAFFPSLGELRINTPGVDEDINLIQVDVALAALGSSVVTRTELDQLFSRIDLEIFDAEQQIRAELLSEPDIEQVIVSKINAYPIDLRLTQESNSLVAAFGPLEIQISGVAKVGEITIPFFCEDQPFSARAVVEVELVGNIITGQLQASPPIVDFDFDVECSGLLSPVVNGVLNNPFVANKLDDLAEELIVDPINNQMVTAEVFGLDDIVPEVRQALSGIHTLTPAQRTQIDAALLDAEDFLNRVDLDTGKTLQIRLFREIQRSDGEGGFIFELVTNVVEINTNF